MGCSLQLLRDQLARRRHFILYSVIGVSGASIDFLVFKVLLYYGLPMHPANFISVTTGITNNFLLNAWFNFRVTDNLWKRFASFYGIGMIGWGISGAFLEVGVDWLHFSPEPVKFLSIVFVVITQYTLNKIVSFAPTKPDDCGNGVG